jgi:hypothetical protein
MKSMPFIWLLLAMNMVGVPAVWADTTWMEEPPQRPSTQQRRPHLDRARPSEERPEPARRAQAPSEDDPRATARSKDPEQAPGQRDNRPEQDKVDKSNRASSCEEALQLRAVQPLVLGTVLWSKSKESGFVAVTAEGDVLKSDELIVKKQPAQAELALCGAPNQAIVLVLAQPSYAMKTASGQVVGELSQFSLKGRGVELERIDEERWEGRLGPSGRALIQVGASAQLKPGAVLGILTTDVLINAEAK